jgi:hypothetical protein
MIRGYMDCKPGFDKDRQVKAQKVNLVGNKTLRVVSRKLSERLGKETFKIRMKIPNDNLK